MKKYAYIVFALSTLFLIGCSVTPTSTTSSQSSTTSSITTSLTSSETTSTTTEAATTDTTTTTLRVFTLTELAQYNGNNGSTAYVAVNGFVYDVTNVSNWNNGWHEGRHLAGTDASIVFESSPHSLVFLNQLTIVGTLPA